MQQAIGLVTGHEAERRDQALHIAEEGAIEPLPAAEALLADAARRGARLLNGLVMPPKMELRQTAEGRIVASVGFDPADSANAQAIAKLRFAKARTILRGAEDLAFDFFMLGYRPIPEDGFPVVGRAPGLAGLYLAVTHSGVTLAPAIGLFAAEELLAGQRDPLLAPYGPARFT